MTKTYQRTTAEASEPAGLAVQEQVAVAMAEIAGDMREGLLALAVGTGLQVMRALFEADVAAVTGPKGKHDPDRVAVRRRRERGSVTLGGRQGGVPAAGARRRQLRGAGGARV